ncbi:hypothetical protein IKP85_04720 [bacterium]|nr:hypothetical protein [bacterium]
MNTSKVQGKLFVSQNLAAKSQTTRHAEIPLNTNSASDNVSFQGIGTNISKKGCFYLRNLSDYMKDVSEITNAFIAAIGTGIIAPAIILVSPGKGDKEDQDKKFFQAIRQPLSAGLALAFQLPMTMFITRAIDHVAYENKWKMFRDDTIHDLIPDKKYLQRHVTPEELAEWESKFEDTTNGKSLKQELEEKIRSKYEEVRLDISDEKMAKEVEKKKTKFLKEKIAEAKHSELLNAKVQELKAEMPTIKDKDLVTEDYKNLAKQRNKAAYEAIEKNAKLSWFDKAIKMMGFSNSHTKALEEAQKTFATDEGLKILKEECAELFDEGNIEKRLRKFVENKDKSAQKLFKGKQYWISLFVNLFMVTASCYALNWAHPRFKEQIDKFNHKNTDQQLSDDKKVEVK